MKKWYLWKRIAAAAVAGTLLLQSAGCNSSAQDTAKDLTDLAEGQGAPGPEDGPVEGGPDTGREEPELDREEPKGNGLTAEYDQEELSEDWEEEGAAILACSGTEVRIEGAGAEEEDGRIRIARAGTYILRGDYQGQICVDAAKEDEIRLILDQFSITCPDSSPIYGLQSKRIILTLAEGTENRVSDGSAYVYADANEDEPDAAIFSKDDLTINGSGKLEVLGRYLNGIRSKDDLKIVSGEISVTAVKDGIKGKDSVSIRDGKISVESGEDGIKANNDQDAEKGYVIVEGGDIQISAGDDGIHAETWLTIHDGSILIDESYEGLEGRKVDINGGKIRVTASDDGINGAGSSGTADGMEGERQKMEADPEVYVRITGGEIAVDSGADGIDSNGDIYVHGGATYISGPVGGGDGALDYNGRALISGGIFAAAGSARMMQTFSEASAQRMLMVYHDQKKEGGTAVSLTDGQGEELFHWSPEKDFECILISLPGLEEGAAYRLQTGEEVLEIAVEGILTQSGEGAGGPGGFGDPGRGGRPGRREGGERPEPPKGQEGAERPGRDLPLDPPDQVDHLDRP